MYRAYTLKSLKKVTYVLDIKSKKYGQNSVIKLFRSQVNTEVPVLKDDKGQIVQDHFHAVTGDLFTLLPL